MRTTYFSAALILGAAVAIFFLGRASISEKTVQVPAQINIDSLKNILLTGKVDSSTMGDLLAENKDLRDLYNKARHQKPLPGEAIHDTTHDTLPLNLNVAVRQFDTARPVGVNALVVQGSDSNASHTQTMVRIHQRYLGDPLNVLELQSISIDPFQISIPVKEYVKEPIIPSLWNTNFSAHLMAGYGSNPGVGGLIHIGWAGVGGIAIYQEHPFWFVTARVGH